jgi:hypothetical protein
VHIYIRRVDICIIRDEKKKGKRFELINLELYIGVRRMRGGRKVDDKKLGIMWLFCMGRIQRRRGEKVW